MEKKELPEEIQIKKFKNRIYRLNMYSNNTHIVLSQQSAFPETQLLSANIIFVGGRK